MKNRNVYLIKHRYSERLEGICDTYADAIKFKQDADLPTAKYYIQKYKVVHYE